MLLSELDVATVKRYARIYVEDDDQMISDVILPAAQEYVLQHTGLTMPEADTHPDLAVACLVLCVHMYDQRSAEVGTGNVNQVLDAILSRYAVNYL